MVFRTKMFCLNRRLNGFDLRNVKEDELLVGILEKRSSGFAAFGYDVVSVCRSRFGMNEVSYISHPTTFVMPILCKLFSRACLPASPSPLHFTRRYA
jgi:hypothetical protein